jgi:hypothetical protein
MTMFLARIALCFALTLAALVPGGNLAAGEFRLPDPTDYCTTPQVIETLKRKVDYKFRGYTKTKIFLVEVIHPRERLDSKRNETHTVARKWCHAKARMNDGTIRDMWYLLEKPWGFAGMPLLSGLEFCIAGLDPWRIYGKDCSTIRNTIGWETENDG